MATSWDPANSDPGMILRNFNLSVLRYSVSGPYLSTRTLDGFTTPVYSEHVSNEYGFSRIYLGNPLFANISWELWSGYIRINGSYVGAVNSIPGGGNFDIACNATYFWVRTNGGNWNNDPTANPALGTGGLAHGVTGTLYLYYQSTTLIDSLLSSFARSSWLRTPPVGFEPIAAAGADDLRMTQQYIIVAHSSLPAPPSGVFKYHQPVINVDP